MKIKTIIMTPTWLATVNLLNEHKSVNIDKESSLKFEEVLTSMNIKYEVIDSSIEGCRKFNLA